MRFSWDETKAATNRRKHGVDFIEAVSVFSDEHARLIADPEHSDDEDRFILLGMSARLHLLVICHCYRNGGDEIRIISVRKATRIEQKQYWYLHHES